jgi:unsaturated rhamnogalacturonyl hydrolase
MSTMGLHRGLRALLLVASVSAGCSKSTAPSPDAGSPGPDARGSGGTHANGGQAGGQGGATGGFGGTSAPGGGGAGASGTGVAGTGLGGVGFGGAGGDVSTSGGAGGGATGRGGAGGFDSSSTGGRTSGPDAGVSQDAATGGVVGQGGGAASGGVAGSRDVGGVGSGGAPGPDAGPDVGTHLAADSLAVRFADAIMTRWPDPASISSSSGFEYNHGIVLRGMEQVYRHTSDARYLAYIKKYVDAYVSSSGSVDIPSAHSFDNLQPSVLLPFLFQQTKTARYQLGADSVRARYDTIPRNADKGYWHKQQYPNQMWLDSIYMGEPFLARYGAVFGTCGSFCASTVVEQILLLAEHVRDTNTGLLYHAWDDSPTGQKASWANPTTGRSPVVWGRALGWYAMALVDTLDDLPADEPGRSDMLGILAGIAAGLKATQDAKTGLWYQVLDQGNKSDNWLETSCSGMFVYALKVGVDRGYLDSSYLSVANAGWQGVKSKVTIDGNGLPTINGAVQGMGVQNDYAGYINQKTLSNSSHGLCSVLLAASEMEAQ